MFSLFNYVQNWLYKCFSDDPYYNDERVKDMLDTALIIFVLLHLFGFFRLYKAYRGLRYGRG